MRKFSHGGVSRSRFAAAEKKAGGAGSSALPAPLRDRVVSVGGGALLEAIRADGTGAVRRLLATTVWVPDLPALLELQPALPDGWRAVARDGAAVATRETITLGRPDAALERQAQEGGISFGIDAPAAEFYHAEQRALVEGLIWVAGLRLVPEMVARWVPGGLHRRRHLADRAGHGAFLTFTLQLTEGRSTR